MKVLCDRHQLQEAFHVVGAIPPLKTSKPIVQHVLLRAEGQGITFYATDFEMSARAEIDSVKVVEPGAVLLPARETTALLRELSEPTLTLESRENRCVIESGSGAFVLLGDDPADFPAETELEATVRLELPAARFLEMVRRTSFAAAREETRYAINGVLLDWVQGCLRMVGTDGRRLAFTYEDLETPGSDARAVVPIRSLQTIAKAVTDETAVMSIAIGAKQIGFTLGNVQLVSQLLESRFPDYTQVIPKVAETTVELDRQQLEKNLRKVAVLSSGDVRMVRFDFTGDSLRLSAESSGIGRADQTMAADVQGAGGTISFNPDFLLDALKVCDQEVIRMDMTDDSTPAKFTLGEAYTYVLMPISGS